MMLHRFLFLELVSLSAVVLLALPASWSLFHLELMRGHDAFAYVPGAVEFYQGLQDGQAFPRWAPDLGGGHGVPLFNFRPPLLYYLSSFSHLLGVSFVASLDLAALTIVLGSGLAMYLLARELFGRLSGVVAAAAYMYAPYFLVDLYVRHALSEFSAFPFIPLAFWGIYRYSAQGRYYQLAIASVAAALLLLSSNPISLMAFPWLALFPLVLAWKVRKVSYVVRGLLALAIGLGLSAYFWLPAFLERDMVHLERMAMGYFYYGNHFVYPQQLLYSPWGYGGSNPGTQADGMSFQVGPVHLLGIAVALFSIKGLLKRRDNTGTCVLFFIVMALVAAFLTSTLSQFLWGRVPLIEFVQFPWRHLALVAAASSFLLGYSVFLLGQSRLKSLVGAGSVVAVLLILGYPHARPEFFYGTTDEAYTPESIAQNDLQADVAREHEPIWVKERPSPALTKLSLLEGDGRITSLSLKSTSQRFDISVDEPATLRVNTFYFPGWRVFVDGKPREIRVTSPEGLMEFELEDGQHQVDIVFNNTFVRNSGISISLVSLVVLVSIPIGVALLRRRATE